MEVSTENCELRDDSLDILIIRCLIEDKVLFFLEQDAVYCFHASLCWVLGNSGGCRSFVGLRRQQ